MKCPSCGAPNIPGEDSCHNCQASLIDAGVAPKGMERRIIEGTVSDLAPRPGINVSMDATLEFAVSEMRANKIGCVLVVDGGELRGVLSEREILMKDGGGAAFDSIPVGGLMRENSICLRETDSLADAFHQMAISGHRHLPVRRQDGLYAVVSARDLMQYLCQ